MTILSLMIILTMMTLVTLTTMMIMTIINHPVQVDHLDPVDHLIQLTYVQHLTFCQITSNFLTQRKQCGNMRTAKEKSVEILIWLLICAQDLRAFARKVW